MMTATIQNYIYCDGSTLNNGQPGVKKSGIGAVLICGGERHLISRAVDADNNHRVEIKAAALALIRALILAPEIAEQDVTLYSDSEYFVDRFNYVIEQSDPDDLWHTLRQVQWMYRSLTVKVVARSKWADTAIHAEADKLAKIGAGMYGTQYPHRSKPPVKVKELKMRGEYVMTTKVAGQVKPKEVTVYAKGIKHAVAQLAVSVPQDAWCIEIKRRD